MMKGAIPKNSQGQEGWRKQEATEDELYKYNLQALIRTLGKLSDDKVQMLKMKEEEI